MERWFSVSKRMRVGATWPEAVVTHGVDRGDVVWADVAVVDGGVGFRDPVRLFSVRVSSDLCQQPQLHRTTLIIPPEEQTQRKLLLHLLHLLLNQNKGLRKLFT